MSIATLGPPQPDIEPSLARARSGRTLHAIKEGWMYKKGGKSFSSFKRRYMILWTNKRIEYYTNDTLTTQKGSVDMQHIEKRAIQRSDKVPKKKQMYGFQIATDKRTWYFAVKEESDREEWIKTLVMLYHAPYHIKRTVVASLDGGHGSPDYGATDANSTQEPPKAELPPPPKRKNEEKDNDENDENDENEDNTNKIVLKYPHKDKEDSVPSDYDGEEILAQLEREYDEKLHPHRKGKDAKGIEWSDDDADELTDESEDSLNASEPPTPIPPKKQKEKEKDEDIDIEYNWDAAISKIKTKQKKKHPGKQSIHWDNRDGNDIDGVLDSDDSLNDSEDEEEQEEDEDVNLAQYQKAVYNNEQPMMSIKKKEIDEARESGFSTKRQAIDWDEDDFDTDSLSDQTEESEEEKEYKPKATPSTKKEKFKPKDEEDVMKELAFINAGHIILKLFQPLEEYLDWKSDNKGKGIKIDKMKRNKYGKQLFIKYGFDGDDGDKWYIESIDAEKVTKKLKKNIDTMLETIDLGKGYQVVFRKPPKTSPKRKVPKKKLNVSKEKKTNGKISKSTNTKNGVKKGGKKPVKSVYIKKKSSKTKDDNKSKSKSKSKTVSPKNGKTKNGNKKSSKKKIKNLSNVTKKSKPKPVSK